MNFIASKQGEEGEGKSREKQTLLDTLDTQFEQYLSLLDEYKSLRDQLERSLSRGFLDIAKANFSATNRMRYGQDYYDERMQASRKIHVENHRDQLSQFTITTEMTHGRTGKSELEKTANEDAVPEGLDEPIKAASENKQYNTDPIRWFGVFTPQPLRSAQNCFIECVEQCITQLASIDRRMKAAEIEIRRTKKRISKAK